MTWGLASGIVPACQSPADVPGPAARSYFFFFDAAFFFVDFFAAFLAPFFFMAILRSPPRALVDRVSGPCGPRNRGFEDRLGVLRPQEPAHLAQHPCQVGR